MKMSLLPMQVIEQGDHVIMFITDKKYVPEVEKLFQPSPFFL